MKSKNCVLCGTEYIPTGHCSKYCSDKCRDKSVKSKQSQYYETYGKKKGWAVGVGSGGLTGSGENNPNYKNGIGIFGNRLRYQIKKTKRYCERCKKDLLNANRWSWCCHHKDHDRTNNSIENLELLCKRCHQMEHNCIQALESSTTKVIRDPITGRYKRIEAPSS